MNYESHSRRLIVGQLMSTLRAQRIDPRSNSYLLKYPPAVEELIVLARSNDLEEARLRGPRLVEKLVGELQKYSMG